MMRIINLDIHRFVEPRCIHNSPLRRPKIFVPLYRTSKLGPGDSAKIIPTPQIVPVGLDAFGRLIWSTE
jgi:hypothetical protein